MSSTKRDQVRRNPWYAQTDLLDGDHHHTHRIPMRHGHVRVVATDAGFEVYWRGAEHELNHVMESVGVILQVSHGWRAILDHEPVTVFQPRPIRGYGSHLTEYHLFTLPSGDCQAIWCLDRTFMLDWRDEPQVAPPVPHHEPEVVTRLARKPGIKRRPLPRRPLKT